AGLGDRLAHTHGRGLDVQWVLAGLEEEGVHAPRDQAAGLGAIALAHLIERDAAGDRDRARTRPHGADDEARPLRGRSGLRGLPGDLRGGSTDLLTPVRESIFGEYI